MPGRCLGVVEQNSREFHFRWNLQIDLTKPQISEFRETRGRCLADAWLHYNMLFQTSLKNGNFQSWSPFSEPNRAIAKQSPSNRRAIAEQLCIEPPPCPLRLESHRSEYTAEPRSRESESRRLEDRGIVRRSIEDGELVSTML